MNKKLIRLFLVLCLLLTFSPAAVAEANPIQAATATSKSGIDFIKGFEGFRPYVYLESSHYYIGYGTMVNKGDYPNGITREQGEALLVKKVKSIESSLNSFLTKHAIALTQNQYDALISFSYNLGTGWLRSTNRISTYLKNGIQNYSEFELVNAIGVWCHAGGAISSHLADRRMKEVELFFDADYNLDNSHNYRYLIFNAGQGIIEDDILFYKLSLPYGQLPEAQRDGFYFAGWQTEEGLSITTASPVEKSLRVKALWSDTPVPEPAPSNPPDPNSLDPETNPANPSSFYSDVTELDWFFPYVSDLSEENFISGYPGGVFLPKNAVKTGEALKLILLSAGYPEQKPTALHWASGYLDLAVSELLIEPDVITDLNAPMTRLLIAQVAAKALSLEVTEAESPFADTADEYVLSLFEHGIIQGSYNGDTLVFNPESSIRRSEISAIVWRIHNNELLSLSLQ